MRSSFMLILIGTILAGNAYAKEKSHYLPLRDGSGDSCCRECIQWRDLGPDGAECSRYGSCVQGTLNKGPQSCFVTKPRPVIDSVPRLINPKRAD